MDKDLNKMLDNLDNLSTQEQTQENVIRLKNERGLIEYARSTKRVITEDNRQVLND